MPKCQREIALVALIWLLVTNAGDLSTLDTKLRLDMSHAWWTGGSEIVISPTVKPIIRGDIRFGVVGADGKRYIAYEQGQSLLMLPADWVGTQLHKSFPSIPLEDWRALMVNLLVFIPLNLAAVLICYQFIKNFGFSEMLAKASVLVWFLGTTFLHYAQHHQQNNQVILLTIIGFSCALEYIKSKKVSLLFLSGLAAGGSILMRVTSLYHALTVVLFLIACWLYDNREKLPQNIPNLVRVLSIWVVGFIPFFALGRWLDYQRYGGFLLFGKKVEQMQLNTDSMWAGMPNLHPDYPFIHAPHVGFLGSLFSLHKSIFIYDPLLLPCLILLVILWKRLNIYIRIYTLLMSLNLLIHLLAYTRFDWWTGDVAWAARYQVTSVQLLLIPLVAVFLQQLLSSQGRKRRLYQGVIALAIVSQLASVAMHPHLEYSQKVIGVKGTKTDFRLGQRMVNIGCLLNPPIPLCNLETPEQKEYLDKKFNHLIFLPFSWLRQSKDVSIYNPLGKISLFLWFGLLSLGIYKTYQIFRALPSSKSVYIGERDIV